MDSLFNIFYAFSETHFLSPASMRECHIAFPGLNFDKVRKIFINCCLDNCLWLLLETFTKNLELEVTT